VLIACFDAALKREPRLIACWRGCGSLGRRQPGHGCLQEKYGYFRVADTGIREATIVVQAIGMALRACARIAEVILDYLLYALQIISDDLANAAMAHAGAGKKKHP